MRSLEGGDWKSTDQGNSLVAYPTSCTVLKTSGAVTRSAEFNYTPDRSDVELVNPHIRYLIS